MKAIYSLELKVGRRWVFIASSPKLKTARERRDRFYSGSNTRIRKWVLPPEAK